MLIIKILIKILIVIMEDSSIIAKYIIYRDIEYDEIKNIKHVSDLNITSYNYGDLVSLNSYRDTGTLIVGKHGVLIPNPDYSGSGYLTIPYKITQYLSNATEKYHNIECIIDLRHDDKMIKDSIGIIPKSWNYKFTRTDDVDMLWVKFPNGHQQIFEVNNTSSYKIKKYYENSLKPQSVIKVYYKIENEEYDKFLEKYGADNYKWLRAHPNIPNTWRHQSTGSGGGSKKHYSNDVFKGPIDNKDQVIKNINKFYEGFNYKITIKQ